MSFERLSKNLRNHLRLLSASLLLGVLSAGEMLAYDFPDPVRENVYALLGYLLIGAALISLAIVALFKCQDRRGRSWEQRQEERELADLIETSVHAGRSALERKTT